MLESTGCMDETIQLDRSGGRRSKLSVYMSVSVFAVAGSAAVVSGATEPRESLT